MVFIDNHEGRCISRGLCEDIVLLTEQRLAFEKKMSDRARALTATRPLSPIRTAVNSPDAKQAGLPEKTGTLSEDHNLAQQQAALGMSTEGRVTYLKLRGDHLLHQAEMARHGGGVSIPECEGLAAEALEAYLTAQKEASSITTNSVAINSNGNSSSGGRNGSSSNNSSSLPELHPLQVELALRVSSVLLHLLDRPVEAWEAGYPVYLAASERPGRLSARSLAIAQVLRDHLACIDIQSGGVPRQQHQKGIFNSEKNEPYQDNDGSISTTHCQAATRGVAEDGQVESSIAGEWGFLRMSAGFDEDLEQPAGTDRTRSDKLRVIAQLKQARASMDVVTATEGRVLLGTMEHADIVQLALKKARE